MQIIRITSAFFVSILLLSCGGNTKEPSPIDNTADRKEILTHWADNIIIPSYSNFKTEFDEMKINGEAFVADPNTTTLANFRTAWQEAYIKWQEVELFEFGPADNTLLRSFMNIYPTDVAGIEANIQDANANLGLPSAYARQGFPALDYLINGTGENDDALIAYFTDATNGAKRIAYVARLVARMDALITLVVNEWTSSYRDVFVSNTSLEMNSPMAVVVNAFVLEYERHIRSGKIGIPSGALISTGGVQHPEKIEAFYKGDISKTLALTANNACHQFFNGIGVDGNEGPSLKSYLDDIDAKDASSGTKLSILIDQGFSSVTEKLETLSPDFRTQIETNNQALVDTFAEMQQVVLMLKVDMTSAMSITITYTDNDGD